MLKNDSYKLNALNVPPPDPRFLGATNTCIP